MGQISDQGLGLECSPQTERRLVQLSDRRVGKIVPVDTLFPINSTVVSIWTDSKPPGLAKVAISDVLGEARLESA